MVVVGCSAFAQPRFDSRPAWTKTVPNPPAGANYFLNWGVGGGINEQQAMNEAWADALRRSLHELGVVGITNQDIDAVARKGIDAVVSFNKMKRRIVCATNLIYSANGMVKVYILIQVQRSVHGKDDFYAVDKNICNDPDFDRALANYEKELKQWMDGDYGFSARAFVPGMAQLHKGSTGKGVFFIASEALLVGGIVVSESLRASYSSKINSTHDATDKKKYINDADNMENLRNGLIAGAAAVYIWNVIDGIVAKGKKRGIAFGNADLQIKPYATFDAGGFALVLNF